MEAEWSPNGTRTVEVPVQVGGAVKLSRQHNRDFGETFGRATPVSANNNNKPTARHRQHDCRGPVVIGCTMIDMHVNTKIDDHFKVSPFDGGVRSTTNCYASSLSGHDNPSFNDYDQAGDNCLRLERLVSG